jgi:hypothetical protein
MTNINKIDKIEKLNEFDNFKHNFKKFKNQKPGELKPYHPPEINKLFEPKEETNKFQSKS